MAVISFWLLNLIYSNQAKELGCLKSYTPYEDVTRKDLPGRRHDNDQAGMFSLDLPRVECQWRCGTARGIVSGLPARPTAQVGFVELFCSLWRLDMISHVAGLFTHPVREWKEIRDAEESLSHLYFAHVLFLALIPPVSMYLGTTKVGWTIGSGSPVMLTESSAMVMSVLTYLALLTGIGVIGAFIDWMSRTYDSSPGLTRSIVFAAYTATPLFLAGLCALYPNVILVMLVGIAAIFYTVYLLYSGIPIFMGISEEEGFVYASSILTIGLVMLVALMAITVLIWSFGFGPQYVS